MFCTHCGTELKEGAKFCQSCGAPATARDEAVEEQQPKDESAPDEAGVAKPAATGFASQMEADRSRSRKKLSPLMIVALVLALLAATALAAVLITQQAGQGEQAPQAAQTSQAANGQGEAAEPEAESEPEHELTEEERVIQNLNGWWGMSGILSEGITRYAYYFENGSIWGFAVGNDGTPYGTDHPDEYSVTGATRLAEPFSGQLGYDTYTSDDGYMISTTMDMGGYYYLDTDPNALLTGGTVGSLTRITNADAIARIENVVGSSFQHGQELGHGGNGNGAADQAATDATAEAEARAAAIAAGKQVFTGTIMATTDNDAWVMSTGRNPNAGSYYTNRSVTILLLDQKTAIEGADFTSSGRYKTLQDQDVIELPDSLADAYNGQRVEMAFSRDDLKMPSDVSHIRGTGEVIFVGNVTGSAGGTGTSGGDYLLAESSTRTYSRAELEALSNHDLFIARNEIYARHGRQFQSTELQQYFGSKSWYRGTISPSAFSESVLSQVERDNANLMLAIEKERNSPYV